MRATEWEDNDLVFCIDTGGLIDPSNVLRTLRLIATKANRESEGDADRLPGFNVHDLRHTHATHLIAEGWPIPTVSRRLGHANPGITMRIYAHALSDVRDEDAATPAAFAFAGIA